MCHRFAVLSLLVCALATSAPAASVVQDFSTVTNASGPWSYGYMYGGFQLLPNPQAHNGTSGWADSSSMTPGVWKKDSGSEAVTFFTSWGSPTWVNLHPGPNGEIALVRYTAPSSGTYSITGRFAAHDIVHTATDISVTLNESVDLFAGVMDGVVDPATGVRAMQVFSILRSLNVGDTIDFMVGRGLYEYYWDTTGLQADIDLASSPEPATLGLLGASLVLFGLVRARRRS